MYNNIILSQAPKLPDSIYDSMVAWINMRDRRLIKGWVAISQTATGVISTNSITVSSSVASLIYPGMIIRAKGTDSLTVANVVTTTITTVEPLPQNYVADTIEIEKISNLTDKSLRRIDYSQSDNTKQGLYNPTAINGNPAMGLHAASTFLTSATAYNIKVRYTLAIVGKFITTIANAPDFKRIWRQTNDSASFFARQSTAQFEYKHIQSDGTGDSGGRMLIDGSSYSTNTPWAIIHTMDQRKRRMVLSNGVITNGNHTATKYVDFNSPTTWEIGDSTGSPSVPGYWFGEGILCNRPFLPEEEQSLMKYFNYYWGCV